MRMIRFLLLLFIPLISEAQKPETYILITWNYHTPQQEKVTEDFVKSAFMPALHRAKYKNIGVFKPIPSDTLLFGKRLHVLIPCKDPGALSFIDGLLSDKQLRSDGATYLDAAPAQPPFDRKEITVLTAFSGLPRMELPKINSPLDNRVYELRSYEGPTELKYKAKVSMFNEGDEIGLFREIGMNGIFYGEVIAGSKMPNLLYMTAYADMATRDRLWKEFFNHPKWKQLLTITQYQNSVSKAEIFLLQPTTYSDY